MRYLRPTHLIFNRKKKLKILKKNCKEIFRKSKCLILICQHLTQVKKINILFSYSKSITYQLHKNIFFQIVSSFTDFCYETEKCVEKRYIIFYITFYALHLHKRASKSEKNKRYGINGLPLIIKNNFTKSYLIKLKLGQIGN